MTSYIVIEDTTGLIVNRIVLDDPAAWEVPEGHSIVAETDEPMAIGGSYVDGVYTPPEQAPPSPLPPVPPQPTAEQSILFNHENRILVMEGYEPLTIEEFLDKLG